MTSTPKATIKSEMEPASMDQSLTPKHPIHDAVESLFLRKRWMEALQLVIEALESNPLDPNIRFKCGYALEQLGEKDAALVQYQEVMTIEPGHADTLFRLAIEAERQGLKSDALSLYDELLLADSKHPQARRHRDCILDRQTESLRIVFLWGGRPFCGDDIEKKPLGGTETATIYMARNLAELGHTVTVCEEEVSGTWQGVCYEDVRRCVPKIMENPPDVLVACRTFYPFIKDLRAGVRIFWTGDAHDQPFVESLAQPSVISKIDRIFAVSQWQADMLSNYFNIPKEKFYVTRNGVNWEHFASSDENRNRKKLIYTSTPFRGLDVLLDVFPEIQKRVPEARLDIYSSMAVYGIDRKQDDAQYGRLYEKADRPGICLKGSVCQTDLARALFSSGIFAYPNHFAETSCIAALEAMAAGVPVVTTRLGALPETVGDCGILVDGDSRSHDYQAVFINEVCRLMTDAELWHRLSEAGRNRVYQNNRWSTIAKEWTDEFEQMLLCSEDSTVTRYNNE